jgi:hypothetical protein
MRNQLGIVCMVALVFATASSDVSAQCRAAGDVVRVPKLAEASGIAASQRIPDRLWAVNDSGAPVIYALSSSGSVAGEIRLTGAVVEDWEAIAVGPCASGSCLYVGDIGDNGARRAHITIYRLPEPATASQPSAMSDVFHATYPDGPQDAEALVVTPDGRLHVITKGETGTVALYRFPRDLQAGASVKLERVGKPRDAAKSKQNERVTDAAVSPHGDWTVLRTNDALSFHRTKDLMAGDWRPAHVADITGLREPQGEGVTFSSDNTVIVAGEGGGKSAGGTFARLSCESLR